MISLTPFAQVSLLKTGEDNLAVRFGRPKSHVDSSSAKTSFGLKLAGNPALGAEASLTMAYSREGKNQIGLAKPRGNPLTGSPGGRGDSLYFEAGIKRDFFAKQTRLEFLTFTQCGKRVDFGAAIALTRMF
jgi:hypothetical protein